MVVLAEVVVVVLGVVVVGVVVGVVVVVVGVGVVTAPSRHMAVHWAPDPCFFLSEVNRTLRPFLAALPSSVTGLGGVLKNEEFVDEIFIKYVLNIIWNITLFKILPSGFLSPQ